MRTGIFITGTDTGVGKTIASAGLILALKARGLNVGYMKPIETGCPVLDGEVVAQDTRFIREVCGIRDDLDLMCPYRLKAAAAPSIASRLEDIHVDLSFIVDQYFQLSLLHEVVVVEGVGGLMVPLNNSEVVTDLILQLGLETVVVAKPGLGTINHTLLTVNMAKMMGIAVTGVVINGFGKEAIGLPERTNPDEIQHFGNVPVLGILPWMKDLDYQACKAPSLLSEFMERVDVNTMLPRDDEQGY
ncbi:MAG: dethiobiotin synthase [Planctomycetes bacterium]|nr:dethiobiotin synthase [Planctomycetota bacterium]MCW8134225.1 dethiobiotin synthase [Planctomycetota bacterium]